MAKAFISYSTKNKTLVQVFNEFLQLGMGVNKDDIFCTDFSESLATGRIFSERVKKELASCEIVISLITEEYLQSKYCLVEMGAAWGMNKHHFPLISVPFEQLSDTPLQGMQMRRLNDSSDISMVYDELLEYDIRKKSQTAEFNKRLPGFIKAVKKICDCAKVNLQ